MNLFVAAFILIVCVLVLVFTLLILRPRKQRVYKQKGPYLLSPGEKRFFDALANSIPSNMYICPKVRLSDVIEVDIPKNDPNFWRHLAPINQKHVDFVLVNRSDFAPRLAIELDGGSHQDRQRANRDAFINSVFQSAGIPILHVPVRGFYAYADLRRMIEQSLTQKENTAAAITSYQSFSSE
jgi:very-short-patch-repair endonuclease